MTDSRRLFTFIAFLVTLAAPPVQAAAPIIPPPPEVDASSYLLMDADTKEVLVQHNIYEPLPPASLTKIMTSYVLAQEIESGRVSEEQIVTVGRSAWAQNPEFKGSSVMWLEPGMQVSIDDLHRGIVISSGNDASVAVAEHVAGSEDAFASMMNQTAAQLGMNNTQFQNASGLPAEGHYTTAWDLALLTRALIENYPEHYALNAEKEYTFNGIRQPNRNRLLWRDRTVDGVKTGHTEAAGYCLVASALRDDMRLISVVMGADSDEARMRETQKLLSYGFRYFETQRVYEAGVPLKTAELWFGADDSIELGTAENVVVTIPRGSYENLEAELQVARVIEAPVAEGDEFGELRLKLDGETVYRAPLVALQAAEEGGMFSQLSDGIYLFFRNLVASD